MLQLLWILRSASVFRASLHLWGVVCSFLPVGNGVQSRTAVHSSGIPLSAKTVDKIEYLGTGLGSRPNILFILVDDLGWGELGFHRKEDLWSSPTPRIDGLVADGVELDRHYTHHTCSPTRSAIQTGRAPIHVNVLNACIKDYNPADPVSGFAGIPRNMTGIAAVMRSVGYRTHMVGKWDVGIATMDHTPTGRGYDSALIYFGHENDYWSMKSGKCKQGQYRDLWIADEGKSGRPARDFINAQLCSSSNQDLGDGQRCVYEDLLFERRVRKIVESHRAPDPFFIFWATHVAHGPEQVPYRYLNLTIDNEKQRVNRGMASFIDAAIGRVVDKLKERDLWENTLIVFSSDNGGHLYSNNYPLRGAKHSNWEGGIRTAAFASGGFVPHGVRGTKQTGLIAAWDWYATFATLAGASTTDAAAASAGLPPIDSLNMWPLISGSSITSPRKVMEIGDTNTGDDKNGETAVGGLIKPPYKIVFGHGPFRIMNNSFWTGPSFPNSSTAPVYLSELHTVCGRMPHNGCLFNIWQDPEERDNLALSNLDIFYELLAAAEKVSENLFSPVRGTAVGQQDFCNKAFDHYGGYIGPFLD